MESNLATTNLLLGIMAVVSVLEGLVIIGIGIAGFVTYKRVSELVATVEAKHVTPAMGRVNAILDDVQRVTNTVRAETDRVDHAIHSTMDRIDDTAYRVRSTVRTKTSHIVGIVRGVRVMIEALLHDNSRNQSSATQN